MSLPLVAIVGRPNVGKSTLYNKFVGGRPALVHDTPGLTRDRRYGTCDYFGQSFRVVDTGGLDPEAESDVIGAGIHRQAERAIAEAEAILFVVDGKSGVSPLDADLGRKLRAMGKPLLLVVNKIDHPNHDNAIHEFRRLGFPEVFPVSATHGRGVDELMSRLVQVMDIPEPVRLTKEQLLEEEAKARSEAKWAAQEAAAAAAAEDEDEEFEDEEEDGEDDDEGDEEAEAADDDADSEEDEGAGDESEEDDERDDSEDEDAAEADAEGADEGEEDAEADEEDDEDAESDDDSESDEEDADFDSEEGDEEGDDAESDESDEEGDDAGDEAPAAAPAHRRGDRGPRAPYEPPPPLRIAFVGRPNAGKSSLCNRLIGEERSLVHHVAGTTTDPVDSELTLGDRRYILVDTAGIRRKAKVEIEIEKIAVSMALGQIDRADVVVLLIDASAGPSEQDARLAGMIEERGKAIVLAINKSDLVPSTKKREALTEAITENFHFLPWAPVVWLSAARGDGVDRLLDKVDQVARQFRRRIRTSELNRFFAEVCEAMPPPIWRGKSARVYYLTQGRSEPPTFLLWTNNAEGLPPSYRRFVANRLRERYGFLGTPLRVISKSKSQRDEARGIGPRYDDSATRPPRPGELAAPRRRARPVGPDAAPPSRAGAGSPARASGSGARPASGRPGPRPASGRPARTGRPGARKVTGNKAGSPGGVKMGRSGTPRAGKPGRAVASKTGRAVVPKSARPGLKKAGRPAPRSGSSAGGARRGSKR
jgi:ribosome-associated GTPase EngA